MSAEDTIIAVSTPAGYAHRAVIRLSGSVAVQAARESFRATGGLRRGWTKTFTVTPGSLQLGSLRLTVSVLLYTMRAPHSYTREDIVEIHLPASPALLDMVLDEFLELGQGVRLAEPGEFTRRAFLNGRIDLAQAEAVLAVVRARNEAELRAAAARREGRASRRCAQLQDRVAELRAELEANLDFSEQNIELMSESKALDTLSALARELQRETESGRGQLASDGSVHVVICGPPNAGKSSLLNRLAEDEKAIVNPAAGTTRDAVQAEIELHGIYFRLTDTAGLDAEGDDLQRAASEMTRAELRRAQLVMLVLDGTRQVPPGVLERAESLPPEHLLCVINKCDLPCVVEEEMLCDITGITHFVHTSALTGEGIEELRQELGRVIFEGRIDASAADCLFNARQRCALRRALSEITAAEQAVREGVGYEFAALNLRQATDALGEISGQLTSQDILDRIFSRFCIGK